MAAPAHAVARHRPVPGDQLPDLRDGRDAGRLSGGARRRRRPVPPRPVVDRSGRRRAGPVPVGQHARQPGRRARRPRRGRRLGPGPRGAGAERRVLRRVHLGRAAAHDPRARRSTACWPCTRCRSGRTWPASGSGSTPAIAELVDYLSEVRKHAGFMVAGPVQAAAVGGVGRRRPRRRPARRATAGRLERMADDPRPPGGSTPRCPTAASTSGSRPPTATPGRWLERLAAEAGVVVSPGEFYGSGRRRPRPAGHGAARRRPRAGGRAASGWPEAPGPAR